MLLLLLLESLAANAVTGRLVAAATGSLAAADKLTAVDAARRTICCYGSGSNSAVPQLADGALLLLLMPLLLLQHWNKLLKIVQRQCSCKNNTASDSLCWLYMMSMLSCPRVLTDVRLSMENLTGAHASVQCVGIRDQCSV